MIRHIITNPMDLVRLRIFARNLQTYENRISDPALKQLVQDYLEGRCHMQLVQESAEFDYPDPEQEFLRRLTL